MARNKQIDKQINKKNYKQIFMKNFIIIVSFTFFTFSLNAQTIGTFTTSVEGGVKGTATEITPTIELYNFITKNTNNTLLFENTTVAAEQEVTFSIASNEADAAFSNFANILSTSQNHLLRVGHTINGVKSSNAASVTGWFGDDVNFLGKNITEITITLKNVKFQTTDNWTNFSYEMSVTISGTDSNVAKLTDK